MMDTFNNDLTECQLPLAGMHECFEAVKEFLDDASDADFRDCDEEREKRVAQRRAA